jgi:hypothetical protein
MLYPPPLGTGHPRNPPGTGLLTCRPSPGKGRWTLDPPLPPGMGLKPAFTV